MLSSVQHSRELTQYQHWIQVWLHPHVLHVLKILSWVTCYLICINTQFKRRIQAWPLSPRTGRRFLGQTTDWCVCVQRLPIRFGSFVCSQVSCYCCPWRQGRPICGQWVPICCQSNHYPLYCPLKVMTSKYTELVWPNWLLSVRRLLQPPLLLFLLSRALAGNLCTQWPRKPFQTKNQ